MWVFPMISFNMTNLMTVATQNSSARNINSTEQKELPGSASGLHLDFQSHTFQLHASPWHQPPLSM